MFPLGAFEPGIPLRFRLNDRMLFDPGTFIFCRIRYRSRDESDSWRTDWPDSDLNFSERISELTTLKVPRDEAGRPIHTIVDISDRENLFRYPMIYMLEVGHLNFNRQEAENLRDYLLRGGFLLVDDFWGEAEWENWAREIAKAFPPAEYPIVDLPPDHEMFQIVFRIKEVPQVPSIDFWRGTGETSERFDSQVPHCRGIFDHDGRLMVVICHNTDLGDGWEREGEDEAYFREFSVKRAYPLGINIVVYAMTH